MEKILYSTANHKTGYGRWFLAALLICLTVQVASAALLNKKLNGPLQAMGNVNGFKISPDGKYVVYRADQQTDEAYELYSAPLDGSTPAVRISALLPTGASVPSFDISSDSQRVVYIGDHDFLDANELYSVPITGGTPTKLNGPLVLDGAVVSFKISPDGKRVAYRADQEVFEQQELYFVPIGGGAVTKINQTMPLGGDVSHLFDFSPDGKHLGYIADQQTNDVDELFSFSFQAGTNTKLNGPLVTDGEVKFFQFSPAGGRIVYRASQDDDDAAELYAVPVDGGTPRKLNDPLPPKGDVQNMRFSPDGAYVVYGAYQDSINFLELYSVPIEGGTVEKMNGTPSGQTSIDIHDYEISPNSQYVVFGADQTDSPNGEYEIYSTPIGGGTPVKLNGALPAGGLIEYDSLAITLDSQQVVFEAALQTAGMFELYRVPITGGATSKLSSPLATFGDVSHFLIRPDNSGVVYAANHEEISKKELFSASFNSSTIIKLSGEYVTGGTLFGSSYQFSDDATHLVYLADQETDGVNELFTTYNNDRPSFSTAPLKTATVDANYVYDVVVTDPNAAQALTVSAPIKPSWLDLIDNGDGTAKLRGRPTTAEIGIHPVTLLVADTDNLTALQIFTIEVSPENIVPNMTSIPTTKVEVGKKYFYAISAEDPDSADPVTITALEKPAWLTFGDNGDGTALLTGTPQAAEIGKHNVHIRVADGDGGVLNQKFKVTVKPANNPPMFSSAPAQSAIEGTEYRYDITAVDADINDSLTISSTIKPDWLTLSDNGNGMATLIGTPATADVGSHPVQIAAIDSKGEFAVQSFEIQVQGSASALAFSGSAPTAVQEGDGYLFEITVDYSGDPSNLTISAPTKPGWLTLVDNGDGTATLSGTPAEADAGTHAVELLVSDGQTLNDTQSFTITVEGSAPAPTGFSIYLPLVMR